MAASTRFRRLLLIPLLLLPLGVTSGEDATTRLRLASDIWPPFTDVEGRMRVAIDLVQVALRREGLEASSEIRGDFAKLLSDLRAGELDGSAALWRNPEREEFLLFSRPYLENRLVLVGLEDRDVSVTSLSLLVGQRIGIVEGYAYGEAIENLEGPVLIRGSSDQDNIDRLLAGDLDYVLADELLIQTLFERHGERARARLEAGSVPIVERSLHFAVRRDLPGAAEIVKRFDAAIGEMITDGTYNRILGLTWIRADVDGDGTPELVLGGEQAGTRAPGGGYTIFRTPAQRSGEASPTGYVVGGKTYQNWEQIPTKYRVPVDREEEPARPGIRMFEF